MGDFLYETHKINPANIDYFAKIIQPLFGFLWKGASFSKIKERLSVFQEPSLNLVYTKTSEGKKLIAFGIFFTRVNGYNVVYRGGAVVDPMYQKRGVYLQILRETIKASPKGLSYLVVRTREQFVINAFSRLEKEVSNYVLYPISIQRIHKSLLSIVKTYAQTGVVDGFIAKNAYPSKKNTETQRRYGLGPKDALVMLLRVC